MREAPDVVLEEPLRALLLMVREFVHGFNKSAGKLLRTQWVFPASLRECELRACVHVPRIVIHTLEYFAIHVELKVNKKNTLALARTLCFVAV